MTIAENRRARFEYHIEEQFDNLLKLMQAAQNGEGNEIGVWVSGFYGSGKSSFTKYLGFALDRDQQVDGTPFMRHLQDRLQRRAERRGHRESEVDDGDIDGNQQRRLQA